MFNLEHTGRHYQIVDENNRPIALILDAGYKYKDLLVPRSILGSPKPLGNC